MLKDIRLHLDADEDKQNALDESLAEHISHCYKNNVRGFRQYIPSLLPYISPVRSQNVSVFCNKWGEYNFVDFGNGRTLYGFHPKEEIQKQFEARRRHAIYVDVLAERASVVTDSSEDNQGVKGLKSYLAYNQLDDLPEKIPVMVVLGMGMGTHIRLLLEHYQIDNLIIYEPEVQYFQASALVEDWHKILRLAERHATSLFLQVAKDGRNLIEDIRELGEHVAFKGFYLYQHYNHPVFNAIRQQVMDFPWSRIVERGIRFNLTEDAVQSLPAWPPIIDMNSIADIGAQRQQVFERNLTAFAKYYPQIHEEFRDYQPEVWLPFENSEQVINAMHAASLTPWSGDEPQQDAQLNFDNFKTHPNKDGLVLGYKGTKLKHYLHYQFVNETETLIESEEDIGQLPKTVKSLIMFGVGLGYQIELLFEQHEVEKLFLCEPNRDIFYASLYSIDWQHVLETIDKSNARLYINIGDDGSHLFRDLLNQFYAIGPYNLAHTFFYQSYYNANLVSAIAQLREQLQVVISMGEYFDHAFYGIHHTKEAIRRGIPCLKANPADGISAETKDVPVFLIGNGPSLDQALEHIKEYQGQAIIVSCGTSLQALYKSGIVPDFHAEIEQNRSTFDWCNRIGDAAFLKQISVLSCNGLHPDTCDLFKDVYLAFKEGESSTVSTLAVLGEDIFSQLKFAFPTVSNFALNLFSMLGFKEIYLFGIDLGFHDDKQHHSKHSGYYHANGEEVYDYAASTNTSLMVPGNLRKQVFTKHEFKVACMVMENTLSASQAECFNCSDGARIRGSNPLALDNILLLVSEDDKKAAVESIKSIAFTSTLSSSEFEHNYAKRFESDRLRQEFSVFKSKSEVPFNAVEDVERLVEAQKNLLFASYQKGKSLLFYELYGTVNYANAMLIKIASGVDPEEPELGILNRARELWLDTLEQIEHRIFSTSEEFDCTSSLSRHREKMYVSQLESMSFGCIVPEYLNWAMFEHTPKALNTRQTISPLDSDTLYDRLLAVVDNSNVEAVMARLSDYINKHGRQGHRFSVTVGVMDPSLVDKVKLVVNDTYYRMNLLLASRLINEENVDDFLAGKLAYFHSVGCAWWLIKTNLCMDTAAIMIPKQSFAGEQSIARQYFVEQVQKVTDDKTGYLIFGDSVAVPQTSDNPVLIDQLGNRGQLAAGPLDAKALLKPFIPIQETKTLLQSARDKIFACEKRYAEQAEHD